MFWLRFHTFNTQQIDRNSLLYKKKNRKFDEVDHSISFSKYFLPFLKYLRPFAFLPW